MKYKIISVLLLLPVLLTLIVFTSSGSLKLPVESKVDRIVLEHDILEPVSLDEADGYRIRAQALPAKAANAELFYSSSDETVATVEMRGTAAWLRPLKEGTTTVCAAAADLGASGTRTVTTQSCFEAYIYKDLGRGAQEVIVVDPNRESSALADEQVYGQYDLADHVKVPATVGLVYKVLGTENGVPIDQRVDLKVIAGTAVIDGGQVRITGDENVVVEAVSKADPTVSRRYELPIVAGGVNVYSYSDLLDCTNRSPAGEKAVLQVSLESRENALVNPGDLGGPTNRRTALFGLVSGKSLVYETETVASTYDVTYLENIGEEANLNVGLLVRQDLYGNGHTINLHGLCYPSKTVNGAPINGHNDLFKGPLPFVEALGMATVYGQDNIGMLIEGDGIVIANVSLKNCNNVSDLTWLDNVGTVLEIMGDGVTVRDSVIANGRNVVRSYSNTGLVIDHCLLQYAREFILKAGSNTFIKPEPNQDVDFGSMTAEEKLNFLSPDLPTDPQTGRPVSDSSLTVRDTFFYRSGFFSIGIETHFAGELLYDATKTDYGSTFPEVRNLAGTSYATELKIEGDTRFYDWKDVSKLDASTLIHVNVDAGIDVNKYFNLQQLVTDYITKTDTDFDIVTTSESGKAVHNVHGGIAFYGGGKNFSTVTFDEEIAEDFKEIEKLSLSGIITKASGTGPFRFNLYTKNTPKTLFGESPSIEELRGL